MHVDQHIVPLIIISALSTYNQALEEELVIVVQERDAYHALYREREAFLESLANLNLEDH